MRRVEGAQKERRGHGGGGEVSHGPFGWLGENATAH